MPGTHRGPLTDPCGSPLWKPLAPICWAIIDLTLKKQNIFAQPFPLLIQINSIIDLSLLYCFALKSEYIAVDIQPAPCYVNCLGVSTHSNSPILWELPSITRQLPVDHLESSPPYIWALVQQLLRGGKSVSNSPPPTQIPPDGQGRGGEGRGESNWQPCSHKPSSQAFRPQLPALLIGNFFLRKNWMLQNIKCTPDVWSVIT